MTSVARAVNHHARLRFRIDNMVTTSDVDRNVVGPSTAATALFEVVGKTYKSAEAS